MIVYSYRRMGLAVAIAGGLAGCTSMEEVVKVDSSQMPAKAHAAAQAQGAMQDAQIQGSQTQAAQPGQQPGVQQAQTGQPGTVQPAQQQQIASLTSPQGAAVQPGQILPPVGATVEAAAPMPVGEPAPGIPVPIMRPGGPTIENAIVAAAVTSAGPGPTVENALASTALPASVQAAQGQLVAGQTGGPPQPAAAELALAYATPTSRAGSPFALLDAQFDTSAPVALPETPKPRGNAATASPGPIKDLISKYAALYELPESLVHRVVHRESRYNPDAFNRGHYGLMQIKYKTARSMGFDGDAKGLFDAESNLKYAIKYLRGAYIVANGDPDHAVKLYARGYYYDAKRIGRLDLVQ